MSRVNASVAGITVVVSQQKKGPQYNKRRACPAASSDSSHRLSLKFVHPDAVHFGKVLRIRTSERLAVQETVNTMNASKDNTEDNTDPAPEKKLFKDWFDRDAAKLLAEQMSGALPSFDSAGFVTVAAQDLDALEMGGRVSQFADALRLYLPESIPEALSVINASLPPLLPEDDGVTEGWLQWPVGQFIADHGLPYFDESMAVMLALTQRFTSEFAVRPFMLHRQTETINYLQQHVSHESEHVRRWCSEGVRPLLPWGKKLTALVEDPTPVMPIMEALKEDESLYVRKSVANCLNDIAKHHPALVLNFLGRWQSAENPETDSNTVSEHRQWITRQALRTLIKQGDQDALSLIGYRPPVSLSTALVCDRAEVNTGESVVLEASLRNESTEEQQLMIDFAVHYVRQGGKTRDKVFKWTSLKLAAGETRELKKKLSLKVTTIRALYEGEHQVDLQINGQRMASTAFTLRVKE